MSRQWGQRAASLVGLAMFGAAIWFLQRELRGLDLNDVGRHLQTMPTGRLLAAAGLALVGYAITAWYDVLALKYAGSRVGMGRTLFCGAVSSAFSNTISLPIINVLGTRVRFYKAWGLTNGEVARVVGFAGISSWVGLLAVTGVAFSLYPPHLPHVPHDSDPALRGLGALFLASLAGYLTLCGRWNSLKLGRWTLPVPTRRLALGQVIVGAGDWLAQAMVVYVLLRAQAVMPLGPFLSIYLAAMLAAMSVHIGLGIFEAGALLLLSPTLGDEWLVSVFIFYRLIYHLVPLVLAMVLYAGFEVHHRMRVAHRGEGSSPVADPTPSRRSIAGAKGPQK